ncbi:MAG: bifunctional folylpolyglutamate synthase/dihydrofolate synthase [Faecalibacterium sp.]|nr:bifunctional folylpolyglutamate synthase/dihydrofolate synthase [Faecalibacterium sp.]
MAALGDPQNGLKFVHVAGTNGKGSTCAMLASCLRAAGYRVGLFTSPFINRFNERMQVNGVPIPDDELEAVTDFVRPHADAMPQPPTEFELITAIGLVWFARQQCDIVVLEVGLGGLMDSTNVIGCPEAAVITALGLDHTALLGDTLDKIAAEKAGIIKPGGDVVYYGSTPEADAVMLAACEKNNAALHRPDFAALQVGQCGLEQIEFSFGGFEKIKLPLVASYQHRNAAVAITVLQLLQKKGWRIPDEAIRTGLETVRWPGRFEVLRRDPVFLLDGSHNPQGVSATAESLRATFPGQKFIFLLSIMKDKDAADMLSVLAPLAQRFVAVEANIYRAMPAAELADRIRVYGCMAEAAGDIAQGVALALRRSAEAGGAPVCALGTLYFSGDVRAAVQQTAP